MGTEAVRRDGGDGGTTLCDPQRAHGVLGGRRTRLRAVALLTLGFALAQVLMFPRTLRPLRSEPYRPVHQIVERLEDDDLRITRAKFKPLLPVPHDAVTLTLQMDLSRAHNLSRIAAVWQGPISAAVLVPPGHRRQLNDLFHTANRHFRNHVTVNVVQATKMWRRYPFNKMRNLAMVGVQTKWLMVLDGDEIPVGGMRLFLEELKRAGAASRTRTVYAMTSWQWNVEEREAIPTSHSELVSLFEAGKVTCKIPRWVLCYSPPNVPLPSWIYSNESLPLIFRNRYEPYFIIARSEVIPFDDRFHGPGGDKISLEFKMAAEGYRFVLLPKVFTFTDQTPKENELVVSVNVELTDQVYQEIGEAHNCSSCTKMDCENSCPKILPLWLPQRERRGSHAGEPVLPTLTIEKGFLAPATVPPWIHITLVVQGDVDRLWRLEQLAEQWDGPVMAAILVPQDRRQAAVDVLANANNVTRRHVTLHLCVAHTTWDQYPINVMRNIAMQDVQTKWMLVIDIDDSPVFNMTEYRAQIEPLIHSTPNPNAVFALMSFQWGEERGTPPRSRAELRELLKAGKAVIKAPHFPQAYEPKNFPASEWVESDTAKAAELRDAYEPYYIAAKGSVPMFDERFFGWGGNFAVQTLEMAVSGYTFIVLPHVFTFVNDTAADAKRHNPAARPELQGLVWKEIGERRGCHVCRLGRCLRDCPWLVKPRQTEKLRLRTKRNRRRVWIFVGVFTAALLFLVRKLVRWWRA